MAGWYGAADAGAVPHPGTRPRENGPPSVHTGDPAASSETGDGPLPTHADTSKARNADAWEAGDGPSPMHADASEAGDGPPPARADARRAAEPSGQTPARAVGTHPGGEAAAGGPRLIGLFPVDLSEAFDVSVALVLHDGWEAGWDGGGGARVDVLPGGTFAAATHVGPYDQISLTVHAVLAWCAERRHPMRGPIREVYVSDPARTPPDELITHLMIPLEEET
ncbi:GyrI-like domain-containing protein [Nonomuraea sp. NEAU-A123]|nr:GyrI-like domain-containing protein [Nonomuraea sp. NEAU-A123]